MATPAVTVSTMVEVTDLAKAYGSRIAVNGVSLSIPRGTCYGLLGPNGAGKTTTISMIAGTLDPDRGTVVINGKTVRTQDQDSKRQIGYVPQELALYEEMSAQDNLRFFSMLYGLSGKEMERAIESALRAAGLNDRKKEPVRQFSGGMKRRLNIGIALLHDPTFLILDEPTVGVDPQSRNLIFETLEYLLSAGKTILYTTHYMEEVERLCKSVAIMDQGKVIADDRISTLIADLHEKNRVIIGLESPVSLESLDLNPQFEAEIVGQTLSVTLHEIGAQLPQILDLIRRTTRVETVDTERPTLEQVFLHLTGRSLRD